MTGKDVTKYTGVDMSITDLRGLAADFAKSGFFLDARDASQAVVKIQAGLEMGFGPVYSMTKIYIVKGKVMVGAEALGALVKRSGRYDYSVKTLTDTECVLEFTDRGEPVYVSKFTMEDAKRADLVKSGGGWITWPRAMLMSKALSQGARIACPHLMAGVYTPADFGVETDEDGDPVITVVPDKAKKQGISPAASAKVGETDPLAATDEQQAQNTGQGDNALITDEDIAQLGVEMGRAGWDNIRLQKYVKDKEWTAKSLKALTKAQLEETIRDIVADSVE